MKRVIIFLMTLVLAMGVISCGKKASNKITVDQALSAVKAYCEEEIPGIEEMAKSEEYTINWEVVSSDEKEIVVLFRSYTGALERYYINVETGDTYQTVVVPGIIDEEQKTDIKLNIKDYIK